MIEDLCSHGDPRVETPWAQVSGMLQSVIECGLGLVRVPSGWRGLQEHKFRVNYTP